MRGWHRSFPARQLRARPLASFTVMFLTGLILAHRIVPPAAFCLCGLAASLLLAGILAAKHRRFAAVMMLVGMLAGMARMTAALEAIPDVRTRYSVSMIGHVVSDPFTNPDTGRVISRFRLESADGEPSELCLRLYLRGDEKALEAIAYGQRLALTGHIWENDPVTNPHEFDFGEYLHRNGMAAIATAKIEDVEILGVRQDFQTGVISFRSAIAERIDAMFPSSAPMVRALILGDRSLIGEELRAGMNATGTAHLIAISGLHVTVLAFALAFVLSLFIPRRTAGIIVLAPLVLYGALIGFTPSYVRALVMFALLGFSRLPGLPADGITRLSAALLICLAVRPTAIMDAGLVLSFSASAGILLLDEPLRALLGIDRLSKKLSKRIHLRRAALFFPGLLCASLAAQLATLPAVIAYYGVQSVLSIPFNLVCVPLCMLGYILAAAALVISALFMPLGAWIASVSGALFSALIAVTRFSTALPVTTVRIGRYPAVLILIHAVVILAASGLSRIPLRIRRFLPLTLIAVAALSSLITWSFAWDFSIEFLDAGQADCAVVRSRGHTWIFDAGDTYTPVADYLCATCLHLDGIVLSHPHQDHAGGLSDILDNFRPEIIYVPEGWSDAEDAVEAVKEGVQHAREMDVPIVTLRAGDEVALSADASMTIWSPVPGTPVGEVNDMSLLALVRSGDHSALFTGDLTVDGEPETVPDCDVLKVAHHGAGNGSSARFLESATPDIAVISVGENNFGHPDEDALARIAASGARILRTDRIGAIRLTLRNGEWRIKTFLEGSNEVE